MGRFRTLRIRFAIWTASLMLIVLVLFGVFVYFSMARGLLTSADDSLRLSTSQAIAAVKIEDGQISFSDNLPESSPADLHEQGLTTRILTLDGKVIQSAGSYSNLPINLASLHQADSGIPSYITLVSSDVGPVRIYTAPILDHQTVIGVIQGMQSLKVLSDTLNQLLVVMLISIPLLLILSAFSGYYLAARALFPIDQITRTAQRISADDLSARLNLQNSDDEVGRLAATLDHMLARLENAFYRERRFTADASHELRTPMTATQAILGVTLEKDRTPEEYRQALRDISEETDRLQGLVENLLFLARSDQQQHIRNEPVEFSQLLVNTAETLRPLANAKGLRFTTSIPEDLQLVGSTDSLIRLFINLLDNAIKYTSQGEVKLVAEKEKDTVQIKVCDTGCGISPLELPHIFDRFYRVDRSRSTQGSGLGLSIAQEIVLRHGGTISVNSQVDQGTEFSVSLPLPLIPQPPS
jgi:heavy metal sensor kinase